MHDRRRRPRSASRRGAARVTHAVLPASARSSGSTLRAWQQASVSVVHWSATAPGSGVEHAQVEVEVPAQLLGVPLGLGEQVAGVEEHDVGVGDRLADEVDEHRRRRSWPSRRGRRRTPRPPNGGPRGGGRPRTPAPVNQIPSKFINFVENFFVRTFDYPVWLDLRDVPVLVVGAGPVAARKVDGLAAAGAARPRRRRRRSPTRSTATRSPSCAQRPYEPADLDGVRLVVTATGDAAVDARGRRRRHGRRHLGQRRRPAGRLLVHPPGDRPARAAGRSPSAPAAPARRSPAGCATAPAPCSPTTSSPSPRDLAARRADVRAAGRIDRGRRLVGAHRPGAAADRTALSRSRLHSACPSNQQYQGGTNREDQGRDPVGDQHAVERRGDRARPAEGRARCSSRWPRRACATPTSTWSPVTCRSSCRSSAATRAPASSRRSARASAG